MWCTKLATHQLLLHVNYTVSYRILQRSHRPHSWWGWACRPRPKTQVWLGPFGSQAYPVLLSFGRLWLGWWRWYYKQHSVWLGTYLTVIWVENWNPHWKQLQTHKRHCRLLTVTRHADTGCSAASWLRQTAQTTLQTADSDATCGHRLFSS